MVNSRKVLCFKGVILGHLKFLLSVMSLWSSSLQLCSSGTTFSCRFQNTFGTGVGKGSQATAHIGECPYILEVVFCGGRLFSK